jgi:hypothetical protein
MLPRFRLSPGFSDEDDLGVSGAGGVGERVNLGFRQLHGLGPSFLQPDPLHFGQFGSAVGSVCSCRNSLIPQIL